MAKRRSRSRTGDPTHRTPTDLAVERLDDYLRIAKAAAYGGEASIEIAAVDAKLPARERELIRLESLARAITAGALLTEADTASDPLTVALQSRVADAFEGERGTDGHRRGGIEGAIEAVHQAVGIVNDVALFEPTTCERLVPAIQLLHDALGLIAGCGGTLRSLALEPAYLAEINRRRAALHGQTTRAHDSERARRFATSVVATAQSADGPDLKKGEFMQAALACCEKGGLRARVVDRSRWVGHFVFEREPIPVNSAWKAALALRKQQKRIPE